MRVYFECGVVGRGIRSKAARALIAAFCIALSAGSAADPAGADLIELPIGAPPDGIEVSLDLGDLSLVNLDQPGGYTISLSAVGESGFTNSVGDVIEVSGSVAFSSDLVADFEAGLLVFTSLRSGSGPLSTCPIGIARAPLAFDSNSFSVGGGSVDPLFVSDPSGPGTLCDDEGSLFLALLFEGSPGVSQSFRFDLELTDELDLSKSLQIVNDAYAITPEPNTALLLGFGLVGLASRRRI